MLETCGSWTCFKCQTVTCMRCDNNIRHARSTCAEYIAHSRLNPQRPQPYTPSPAAVPTPLDHASQAYIRSQTIPCSTPGCGARIGRKDFAEHPCPWMDPCPICKKRTCWDCHKPYNHKKLRCPNTRAPRRKFFFF
jgi:IBR domain, a half RING-finger domain